MIPLLFSLSIFEYNLGIPFSKLTYHMQHFDFAKETFTCYDGSNVIPFSKYNDHHRDCNDGSDEMGTSEGPIDIPFTCINAPFIAKNISRSQVNDGICDCCDGSDENLTIDHNVQCPNTCEMLNQPRYLTLNDLKGVMINGISHRRVLESGGKRLLNVTESSIERYKKQIIEIKEQIKTLEEEEKSLDQPPTVYQMHPFLTTLWKKLFFIQDDYIFDEVFYGTKGKINCLNKKIEKLNSDLSYTQYKYALLIDKNISIQYFPLYNVSFPLGDYDFLFLSEMKKGNISLGKLNSFDEKNRVIYLDDGDFCPEINEGRKTTINIECWNEGQLFEVNETSPCIYQARVGTQETCDILDIYNLLDKTLEELLEIKKKNNYKK